MPDIIKASNSSVCVQKMSATKIVWIWMVMERNLKLYRIEILVA